MDSARSQHGRGDTWGVRPALLVAGCAVSGLLLAVTIWLPAPEDKVAAGTGFLVIIAATATAARLRERLELTADGFRVRGALRSREIGWAQVAGIASASRRSRGVTSTSLEIELADDSLIIFGRLELGTDPAEVGDAVRARWLAWRAATS